MTDNPDQILEATEGFVCELEGRRYFVQPGTTRVSASHILARTYPTRFRAINNDLTYAEDVTATREPGNTEGRARTSRAKTTTAAKE